MESFRNTAAPRFISVCLMALSQLRKLDEEMALLCLGQA
jgi:hypothetical protein